MHHEAVILCIDEGTSGTRAAVVGRDGQVSAQDYLPLEIHCPRPGVVEQDADLLLERTLDVCRRAIARAQGCGQQIVALAIANQRCSAVLWDTATGRSLAPIMVWQDSRHREELALLAGDWDARLIRHAGRPVGVRSPYLWAARKLREDAAVARAWQQRRLAFGTIDSWLLWHLSDARAVVTTPTNVTSGNAYALGDHRYLQDWLDALEFPAELLPRLCEDVQDFGRTRTELLGLAVPILACAGDQHAAAVGLGCLERGQALCVHGTGSFVDVLTGTNLPAHDAAHESSLTMTARRMGGVSRYAIETYVPTTGSALNWICEKLQWFDNPQQISTLAGEAETPADLVFIPALTGLRLPAMEPGARASISGVSMATSRPQLARSILEGIAHSVASCVQADEAASGTEVGELLVGGGLSGSDALLQIQADLGGLPVRRLADTDKASLRGIAFMAGSSGLLWDGLEQACATLRTEAVFDPRMAADERGERRRIWRARVGDELARARAPGRSAALEGCA